jgi:hypothetical protein
MPKLTNPGRYPATVTSAEFGESDKGTPYLLLSMNTEGGETADAYLYLSEKALPNALKTLRDAFDFDGNFETAVDQVTGRQVSITCEIEEYDGKERCRVKWINKPRSGGEIANKDSFLKALSAKAARIPAAAPKATTTRPPAARPAPTPF